MWAIKCKIMSLILYSDLLCTRFTLGLSELLWAITLFWPGNTFGRPTYHAMAATGLSEEMWGVIWLVTGFTQMYILFSGRHHTQFAVAFAGFNAILWWFVILGCYVSVHAPAAMSGEVALCIAASWVYIRSGWMPKKEAKYGSLGE